MNERPCRTSVPRATAPAHLAIIAGSGMGNLADSFRTTAVIPFRELGAGYCSVEGHVGEVRRCQDGDNAFTIVLGRRHHYEDAVEDMSRVIRWLADNEVTHLLVTSAAGSLRRNSPAGEFVMIRDTMDFQNRRAHGTDHTRPDSRPRVDAHLTADVERSLCRAGVPWSRGVLACGAGPAYETPAEVQFFQYTGASLVTMSSVPEILLANRYGLTVAALGLLTNPGTGIAGATPDHHDVLEVGHAMSAGLTQVISQLLINK